MSNTLSSLSSHWRHTRSVLDFTDHRVPVPFVLTQDENLVPVAFSQLIRLGESSIWEVLKLEWGQLVLRSNIGLCAPRIWMQEIINHVSQTKSTWHSFYLQGYFSRMEYLLLDNRSWETLSQKERSIVVQESLRMVPVHHGQFIMGAPHKCPHSEPISKPDHKVILTKGFEMGAYPVTIGLFEHVMSPASACNSNAKNAAFSVTWEETVLFCNQLSKLHGLTPVYSFSWDFLRQFAHMYSFVQEKLVQKNISIQRYDELFMNNNPGANFHYYTPKPSDPRYLVRWNREANGYRLPTEAEWEYAARAGADASFSAKKELVWEASQEDARHAFGSQPVGCTKPNAWGLYDTMGNVSQWVWDGADFSPMPFGATTPKSGSSIYSTSTAIDPAVDTHTGFHFLRGSSSERPVPVTHRWFASQDTMEETHTTFGFRVVRNRS